MENKEVLLLVVASADDEGLTPLQLQKSLFLVGECSLPELPSDFYTFVPYNYGPFNPVIYGDAESLAEEGLLEYINVPGQKWSKYAATTAGLARAGEITDSISNECSKYIKDVVDWVLSLTFSELLRAIYTKYPKFRSNSVFQG
ncbi:MAG: hypothetical protein A2Z76_04755 [Chloroflexi bacterium RBG_13_56_8b]|nr:MAG: hypothetical protein A2Z76_04755 [Chloroflexi bacterium RBG_13_56_8b]